jgi:hypothetical protein
MNVLPLVFSFLALFTILTYTRLSGFVISKAIHHEYEQFVSQYQEVIQEKAALDRYDEEHREKPGDKKEPKPKVKATRVLNLYPLTQNDSERSKETKYILINLIKQLFDKAPFFEEAKQDHPQIVEELVDAIQLSLQKRKDFKKEDLPTLELDQPHLQFFLYKILKDPSSSVDEDNTEKLLENLGSKIFNDLITCQKGDQQIRMFLADPKLLLAIFENNSTVEQIVTARKSYYLQVKKDPTQKEALTEKFCSQFLSNIPPSIQKNSLNWEISGTNPDQKITPSKAKSNKGVV